MCHIISKFTQVSLSRTQDLRLCLLFKSEKAPSRFYHETWSVGKARGYFEPRALAIISLRPS